MGSPALMIRGLAIDLFGDLQGVGLDFVDVKQVRDLVDDGGQPFLDACWTPTEQSEAQHNPERLAGRWAAKEAVMKCLGAGIGDLEPTDIEISTEPSGAPTVSLHGRAAQVALGLEITGCLVSISHENGWAGAIAVAHRRPDSSPSLPSTKGRNGGGPDA